jgi:hypothetical protein
VSNAGRVSVCRAFRKVDPIAPDSVPSNLIFLSEPSTRRLRFALPTRKEPNDLIERHHNKQQ